MRGLVGDNVADTAVQRGLELYRRLIQIRRGEEAIIRHYGEDEMKSPMHMSMGQEATPVGLCVSLGARAQIITSYRSHAGFLAQTGDLVRFYAEMYGRVTGTAEGKSGSMHLASLERGHLCSTAIVGAGLPMAIGAAFANKQQKNGKIVMPMFGDGATEEGSFWETMNVASIMKLPVIFVLEDNDLAVHTRPDVRRGFTSFKDVAASFSMPYLRFDDNDPQTACELGDLAQTIIDTNHGPVFFHAICYRYLEHVGVKTDFHIGYREKAEHERWLMRDCVDMQRNRLIAAGQEKAVAKIEQEVDYGIADAIAMAKAAAFPSPDRLMAGIFHEAH